MPYLRFTLRFEKIPRVFPLWKMFLMFEVIAIKVALPSPKADASKASNYEPILLSIDISPFHPSSSAYFWYDCVDLHLAWLQVAGINELRLLDPGRTSQLVRELKNTANQRPSSLPDKLEYCSSGTLSDNNFKKHFCDSVAILRIDNEITLSFSQRVAQVKRYPWRSRIFASVRPGRFPSIGPRIRMCNTFTTFCFFGDVVCVCR